MRAFVGARCSGTYLYSYCMKPGTSTTSARERSHRELASICLTIILFWECFVAHCVHACACILFHQCACVLVHIRTRARLALWETSLIPPVKVFLLPQLKVFLLTVPRRCFFCGSFLLVMFRVCRIFLPVYCSLVLTCWERADILDLLVFLTHSDMVSWVRYGAWLYRFLIFSFFLTLI